MSVVSAVCYQVRVSGWADPSSRGVIPRAYVGSSINDVLGLWRKTDPPAPVLS